MSTKWTFVRVVYYMQKREFVNSFLEEIPLGETPHSLPCENPYSLTAIRESSIVKAVRQRIVEHLGKGSLKLFGNTEHLTIKRYGGGKRKPRLLRRVLYILLALALLLFLVCACLLQSASRAVPVLNYHQINDWAENPLTVHTDQFEKQMKYLKENGYHTITPAELLDAWQKGTPLPEKPVVLTFDDGYVDNYQNVYPILRKYGLKGTIFVVTDFMSQYPNYMTWEQVAELNGSGIIDIESHTLSHPELDKLDKDDRWHQLKDSKDILEERLNKKISFIAYPCGSYDEELEQLTKDAGYRAAFTVHYGLTDPSENPFVLDRIPIFGGNSHTFLRFKLRLAFTPIFAPIENFNRSLAREGHSVLTRIIPTP